MENVRIHKWIAQLGLASRRQAERWILAGRVTLNGQKVGLGDRLNPRKDSLVLDGKKLCAHKPSHVYWMLHKPDRVLTTRKKEDDRATIYDLAALKQANFLVNPVGRLDFRTEGLLLLTNDGDLAYRLMHPSFQIERCYLATVSRRLSPEQEKCVKEGVMLEDGICKASLKPFLARRRFGGNSPLARRRFGGNCAAGSSKKSLKSSGDQVVYQVVLREGRNHLVRRLFQHFDAQVIRLIRQSFGAVSLGEGLSAGDLRPLTSEEIKQLKKAVNLEKAVNLA